MIMAFPLYPTSASSGGFGARIVPLTGPGKDKRAQCEQKVIEASG
jgi:hypothetical protein